MEDKYVRMFEDLEKYMFEQWNYNRSHIDYKYGNNRDGMTQAYSDMRDKLFDLKRVYGINYDVK